MSDYSNCAKELKALAEKYSSELKEAGPYNLMGIEEMISNLNSLHESWTEDRIFDGSIKVKSHEYEGDEKWN